ncbi:MAG: hypothetical protein SGILL_003375 [Bacillariaceae sp.]
MNFMNNDSQDVIALAAQKLGEALQGSDHTTIEQVLSRVRRLASPPLSKDEQEAHRFVTEAVAAQRSVALWRTEARLYSDQATRTNKLLPKLKRAAHILKKMYDKEGHAQHAMQSMEDFIESFLKPYQDEEEKQLYLANEATELELEKIEEFVVLRRKAHVAVSKLMVHDERQIQIQFSKALMAPKATDADQEIYRILTEWDGQSNMESSPKQFVPEGYDSKTPEYSAWLRQQAATALATNEQPFGQMVQNIATNSNGTATIAPLKSYVRTAQKVQDKYKGDFNKILDLVRGMVVFGTLSDLAHALILLYQDDSIKVLRAKNRMSTHYDASQMPGGYRDVLLNVQVKQSSSKEAGGQSPTSPFMVVELQLHLAPLLKIKNDRAHVNYELARSVHVFNSAFTTRYFLWEPDTDPTEVEELLNDIQLGIVTKLNLDHSTALWEPGPREQLRKAFQDERCATQEVSLRSCRCGDDFLECVIEEEFFAALTPETRPMLAVVRLGSVIHQGTAGRISEKGIGLLLKHFNISIQVLDVEGCLDMNWYEKCGDSVAEAFVVHIDQVLKEGEEHPLPHFRELNLRSTGLTESGLARLREKLSSQVNILHDADLRKPPRKVPILHS